jgi:CubicO group peptidase (beta-lactamase class C family)
MSALLLAMAPAQAASPRHSPASLATFQISRSRLDKALAEMVSSGRAVGVWALVWRNGREVYFGTAGLADREAKRLAESARDQRFMLAR